MSTISFTLSSPEEIVCHFEARIVVVPALEGDMGIMVGHASIIAPLRSGIIVARKRQGTALKMFVEGGLLRLTSRRLFIFVERAIPLAHISLSMAKKRLKEIEKEIAVFERKKSHLPLEYSRLQRNLATAVAQIKAVEKSCS